MKMIPKMKITVIINNQSYQNLEFRRIQKEEINEPTIWNYTEIPGIKVTTLIQLGEDRKELDF